MRRAKTVVEEKGTEKNVVDWWGGCAEVGRDVEEEEGGRKGET